MRCDRLLKIDTEPLQEQKKDDAIHLNLVCHNSIAREFVANGKSMIDAQ